MEITSPRLFQVRQKFPRPCVSETDAAVRSEMERLFPPGRLPEGARIGVTVGSRGIVGIADITRSIVSFLRSRGARPFIIPAMGSHGGARADGQRRLIGHYGVTEEAMGVPILDAMETRSLGRAPSGVEVFLAETACDSDGILLVNRVKPHTDYKGTIESGLAKMAAIGLGKLEGAREYHSHLFGMGLGAAIRTAAEYVLSSGRIIGGLAILENAYHETARLEAVEVEGFFDHESRLLEEARGLMGRLPLSELDVLICDRMGKNISGTGLDTNIIGRNVHGFIEGVPWQEGMPGIYRVVVLDLSSESEGNAVGMGMVDFAPERFRSKVDMEITFLNAITACAPANAKLPAIVPDDREAIHCALRTGPRREGGPILAHIRDTLELEKVCLSEACLPMIEGRDDLEVLTEPAAMRFDATGSLLSPFVA